jgi:hypothetical protein
MALPTSTPSPPPHPPREQIRPRVRQALRGTLALRTLALRTRVAHTPHSRAAISRRCGPLRFAALHQAVRPVRAGSSANVSARALHFHRLSVATWSAGRHLARRPIMISARSQSRSEFLRDARGTCAARGTAARARATKLHCLTSSCCPCAHADGAQAAGGCRRSGDAADFATRARARAVGRVPRTRRRGSLCGPARRRSSIAGARARRLQPRLARAHARAAAEAQLARMVPDDMRVAVTVLARVRTSVLARLRAARVVERGEPSRYGIAVAGCAWCGRAGASPVGSTRQWHNLLCQCSFRPLTRHRRLHVRADSELADWSRPVRRHWPEARARPRARARRGARRGAREAAGVIPRAKSAARAALARQRGEDACTSDQTQASARARGDTRR